MDFIHLAHYDRGSNMERHTQAYQMRLRLLNWQLQVTRNITMNKIMLAKLRSEEKDARVLRMKKTKNPRTVWVKKWVARREKLGMYEKLVGELEREDLEGFKNFMRMRPPAFYEILHKVERRITKKETNWRKNIPPAVKLAITLRYLATGQDYRSLAYAFRVAHNTISKFIPQVCDAIFNEYSYLIPCPNTTKEWKEVASVFSNRWNFEHCLGAIDGKHIRMKCPKHGGSIYYNYKGFHSIILMALVDGDYSFLWVDVGANGSAGDAQVFNNSDLKTVVEAGKAGFPEPEPLPGDDKDMPYFFIGDDAFALKQWMMKPFSKRDMTVEQRIYNYRLSRGRRIVENAFGILAHRFRCLLTTLQQQYKNVVSITMACVVLHNYLRKNNVREHHVAVADREDENHNVIRGAWRKDNALLDGEIIGGNRQTKSAKYQREYLCAYYNSDAGSVPWQNDKI